jgi:hypothetical protein
MSGGENSFMKYLTVATAILAGGSSVLASPSPDCPTTEPCVCVCREIIPALGETVATAEKRLMTADLVRLIERYVTDATLRAELRGTVAVDAERVSKHIALAKAKFSEADRACYKRVVSYFNC